MPGRDDVAMQHELCTVLIPDAELQAKALVLQRSLARVWPGRRLHALVVGPAGAGDEMVRAAGGGIVAVEVGDLADPELAAVRSERTASEFTWTAKPSLCLHVLRRTGADTVTFLDADQRFFADPAPVLDGDLAGASIGLIPHRHRPEQARRDLWAGRLNAAWATFRNDEEGLAALRWWRDRNLEWCSGRPEPGRYGDQVYLEELPRLFDGARVLDHPGLSLGPWSDQSAVRRGAEGIEVAGRPLVLYHFQSLRFGLGRGSGRPAWRVYRGHRVGERERELLWRPYVREVSRALSELSPSLPVELRRMTVAEALREWRRHLWVLAKDRGLI
jgi:hypothetical protein